MTEEVPAVRFERWSLDLPLGPSPPEVLFGEGAFEALPGAIAELGVGKVLIVGTPGRTSWMRSLRDRLGEGRAHVFSGARPHVPAALVDEVMPMIEAHDIEGIVAVGGGSAIGLGKALSLRRALTLIAAPTTYSGSEMTNIFGITSAQGKRTGRDERVRPALVAYDPALVSGLPRGVAVVSLFNAMAHAVEALYAPDEATDPRIKSAAEEAIALIVQAVEGLIAHDPEAAPSPQSLLKALRGAMLAGATLAASMGVHHKLAHVLGGRMAMPHAPTHTALLPHSAHFNSAHAPRAMAALRRALQVDDGPAGLFDLIKRAGAETRLSRLGLRRDALKALADEAAASVTRNPRATTGADLCLVLEDAHHGRRPCADLRRLPLPGRRGPHADIDATVAGPPLPVAEAVILSIHGRGAHAESLLGTIQEALGGDAARVTIIAPQASDNAWYPHGFMKPISDNQPWLDAALETIDVALEVIGRHVQGERVLLVGFSQGACLVTEYVARRAPAIAGVLAFTGGMLGPAGSPLSDGPALQGLPLFLGASTQDKWVPRSRIEETATWLGSRGAHIKSHWTPGDGHAVTAPEQEALKAMTTPLLTSDAHEGALRYMSGLGNAHASEALPGALPRHQNTPFEVPYGLYPEQINGTAFTVRRAQNQRTWLYRIRPSVKHSPFQAVPQGRLTNDFREAVASPELMRWRPLPMPDAPMDFIEGLHTVGGSGDVITRDGFAVHLYAANADMGDKAFYNSDGDLLIAPELGSLRLRTEFGRMHVDRGEFVVIPRGLKFSVSLPEGQGRGYVLEVYNGHFQLPERGPIGANGLADERHFLVPTAEYEDRTPVEGYRLQTKFGGRLHEATQAHSPFDVVAWHGNYVPYKYDVARYNSMGSVSFDHPDPSLLTVMTVPRDDHGNAVADVIFFPGRWDVAENTFRPPYLHRNAAVEFSGIIKGAEVSESGYVKGMCSVTPGMSAHGIYAPSFNKALSMTPEQANKPQRMSDDSLWIMFESTMVMKFTPWALNADHREQDFRRTHEAYQSRFHPDHL